jgi:hypothetical protein
MKTTGWIVIALIVVALAAVAIVRKCERGGGETSTPATTLRLRSLQNMTYQSEGTSAGWVRLTDGKFEDAPGHVWVTMLENVAWGDITGDGRADAVVVLATTFGGSGVFHNLALVADVDGVPVNLSVAELGDRVKLEGLEINDQAIFVEMVVHGPSDPMCCPTKNVTRVYGYDSEGLRLMEQIPPDPAPAEPMD